MIDKGDLAGHTIRIANTTPCSEVSVESQTACGFVLEFVDSLGTRGFNDTPTNAGGWPASAMRTYLNNEEDVESIYNLLPEDLRKGIIETYVVSGNGNDDTGTREDGNFESIDKLYLLSTREIWGANPSDDTAATSAITRQLDYYNVNNVTLLVYDGAIKNNKNGNATTWWLRTLTWNINTGYAVSNVGEVLKIYNPKSAYGVSPAFRIAV